MLPNHLLPAMLSLLLASQLPTFEHFREADRERRQSGQLYTEKHLDLIRTDEDLVKRTAGQHPRDAQILWGAAELLSNWQSRRAMFESALQASGTNAAIALRFACAAARNTDSETADRWLKHCRQADPPNSAPWIAETWLRRQQNRPADEIRFPAPATTFSDYGAEAARARIRTLEAAGYTAYSARRLGFTPNLDAAMMLKELTKPPPAEPLAAALLMASRSLQRNSAFVVTELIAQSVERALLIARPDAQTSEEVADRLAELDARRDELKELVGHVERNAVDLATEAEMVQYFDTVLALGEEIAMKRLAQSVRTHPVD